MWIRRGWIDRAQEIGGGRLPAMEGRRDKNCDITFSDELKVMFEVI